MSEQKTTEQRLTLIETQQEALTSVLHQFVAKITDLSQKHSEIGMYVAALMRTIFDSKPITKEALAESSVLNQVDKLNNQVQMALSSGILTPVEAITEKSVVVAQQFDDNKNEINRRILMDVGDMADTVKPVFLGKKVSEEVQANTTTDNAVNVLLIHEIYDKVDKVEKAL